jgi:hypothetical protein
LVISLLIATALPVAPARAAGPVCDTSFAPTTTVYLPNITKTLGGAGGWVTPFIVQNVGFFSTTLEVSFYRFSDGGFVTCRKIAGLDPSRSFADVPNNDVDLPGNSQFSVVVRSFGSEIVSVVNEQAGAGERAEALSYVGLTSGDTRVALPYVAKSVNGWLTTMVIQNVGASETTVTASFTSFDGGGTTSITRSIGPGRSRFIDPTVEPSLSAGTEYSAVLTASQPIAAVVNAHNDAPGVSHPMGFSYNGVPAIHRDATYVPLVARNAGGVGRTSRVIVQNTDTTALPLRLTFRPIGGGAEVLLRPTVPAGRSWSFDPRFGLDGATPCPASGGTGCLADGEYSLVVARDGPSGKVAVLDVMLSPESAMGTTGAEPARSRVYLPNVTRRLGGASGWTTPIIVQSGLPSSASLRWFRFTDGRLVTQQILSGLVPGASVRVDPRDVPALADDTQYAVVLDANGPVTAIVTELAGTGGDSAMIYEGFASPVQPESVPAIVAVSPSTNTAALGTTAPFSVTVTDQFGSPADPAKWPVAWTVSPPELGTVSASGMFTASGYGSGKVVATAGAASAAATITVASPAARKPAVDVPVGYSFQTVDTSRGRFGIHVIKQPLANVTVKTVTGNATDCFADCPVQPLVEYLNQTSSFAGMNGTYLCPPDYSWCAGKVNSYDYAVYSSTLGTWLNEWALVSPQNAIVTISGKTLRFYRHVYSYDRGAVDGAISNFPILLLGGSVVDTEAEQADHQKIRGAKGSIGTDGTYVYLSLVMGATVTESAYALQAMGVVDAMNLDGGGTSAMFADGGYTVGPGRQLPNAVVLTRP